MYLKRYRRDIRIQGSLRPREKSMNASPVGTRKIFGRNCSYRVYFKTAAQAKARRLSSCPELLKPNNLVKEHSEGTKRMRDTPHGIDAKPRTRIASEPPDQHAEQGHGHR
jgi:hypothetical protein